MNIEDKNQNLVERSEKDAGAIIRQSTRYQQIYENFEHKLAEINRRAEQRERPTFYERILYVTGRGHIADSRIAERREIKFREASREASRQIIENLDASKRVSITLLDEMISLVKGLKIDFEYQKKNAIGSEVTEIVNLEAGSRRIDAMLLTCREEIEFVEGLLIERNPSIDYQIDDIRWAYLDIKNMPKLLDKDVLERSHIYKIWDEYTDTLQDAEVAFSSGRAAKVRLDNYNFLESMCKRYQRLYEGERRIIHERFAMLELAIKSRGLQGMRDFYEEEVGAISLKQLKEETKRVEQEVSSRFGDSFT
ncbi:hypothetical protein NIES2135_28910 [Leptolyngbya boryana NIES-2135]|jgi:hypothetical protein|uniref:Uncharacterized protein n=1 Tax=Leptolyngbya boryana NIES-2135 TaxID=1973484 RepID=A0A1Z4JHC9_LEPBY|nr:MULTISPECIES: hypothetical protein [Leptolyngbya]BAY56063.1 hypothetical protein NIES2135_28910 [Leptolyngbya boryana NIES-2135]MBD2366175.1 hypothetical protein [Leptolyngbya sp. FACHB-161]MBD2372355.1 hypothetical protein [Leptolyngbya sp. FACHB-238]MBD2396778.1 hypothetical protein [Leptolyngbya sp. FACHB-239]MBD2403301.1 hypothetical protein [Leptolyngbya sp. FACHB-402]